MKVDIVNEVKGEVFKPFEILLKIETEQELCNLYKRLNISVNEVEKQKMCLLKHGANNTDTSLWRVLDGFINKFKLTKENKL